MFNFGRQLSIGDRQNRLETFSLSHLNSEDRGPKTECFLLHSIKHFRIICLTILNNDYSELSVIQCIVKMTRHYFLFDSFTELTNSVVRYSETRHSYDNRHFIDVVNNGQ